MLSIKGIGALAVPAMLLSAALIGGPRARADDGIGPVALRPAEMLDDGSDDEVMALAEADESSDQDAVSRKAPFVEARSMATSTTSRRPKLLSPMKAIRRS